MEEREEKLKELNREIDILMDERDLLVDMKINIQTKLDVITIILEHKSAERDSVF